MKKEIWLDANDIRCLFKYADNLYGLNEISFNCGVFGYDNNDECFSEYKEKEFPNLEKLSISCIIIILFINIIVYIENGGDKAIKCLKSIINKSPKLRYLSLVEFFCEDGSIKSLFGDLDLSRIETLELKRSVKYVK